MPAELTTDAPVYLLGAGASVDAGLKATAGLTHDVVLGCRRPAQQPGGGERGASQRTRIWELSQQARRDPGALTEYYEYLASHQTHPTNPPGRPSAINFVYGRLRAHAASADVAEQTPIVDLEDLVSTLEALAERRDHGLEHFVSQWDPALLEVDHTGIMWTGQEPAFFNQALYSWVEAIVAARTTLGGGQPFRAAKAQILRELPRHLEIADPARLDYLEQLAKSAPSAGGLTVVTLNFDLTLESAAEQAGVDYSDGWASWHDDMEMDWNDATLRIIKLHGSVGWQARDDHDEPTILLGGNKVTGRGPYAELMGAFRSALRQARRLVIVGYSFRDEHVNAVIGRWIQHWRRMGETPLIEVIDPGVNIDRPLPWPKLGVQPEGHGYDDVATVTTHAVTAREYLTTRSAR